MARRQRNAKGQFVKRARASRATNPRPRRKYRRRNYMTPGPTANPRRRRRATATRRRRRTYRRRNYYPALANPRRSRRRAVRRIRNPRLFGLDLPPLRSAIFTAAGMIVPGIAEAYITPLLPAALSGNTIGRWAVKVGSVALTGMAARMAIGRREAQAVLIGGGAWLVLAAITEFAPGMIPGVGAQPLLGRYPGLRRLRAGNGNGACLPAPAHSAPSLRSIPDRINPMYRF